MTTSRNPAVLSATVHVVGLTAAGLPDVARAVSAGGDVVVYGQDVPPIVEDLAARQVITWDLQGFVPLTGAQVAWAGDGDVPAELALRWRSAGAVEVTDQFQDAAPVSLPGIAGRIRLAAGEVWLVGAGPGRPELITVGCFAAVAQADVVVADRLVAVELLAAVRRDAELVDVAKIPRGRHTTQEAIHKVLVDRAQAGLRVVRLKGGDPFLFGRGGEEVLACQAASVPVRWLPGVSSAVAVPGAAGVPVTHRGISQGVCVVSGHVPPGHAASTVNWAAVAQTGNTVVVLMGVANAAAIAAALRDGGLPGTTPMVAVTDRGHCVAVAGDVTAPGTGRAPQTLVLDRLTVNQVADGVGLQAKPPAVLVFGDVADAIPDIH